ncbi:hypothetical protein [Paraburkholderia tropica]|uniref:hypothetical protein n=1 Tax=Paraburkholderia tropica TaxID=92647 RepID=UPI002AAFE5F0|nr:hypothetical protein [Paraburkholderia tropica]
MYDALEVLFFHRAAENTRAEMDALRDVVDGEFEIEEHEFLDASRQVIRIASISDVFDSAYEFEGRLRELADEDAFSWKVIGVVPVGQRETELV